jgi:FG-GAP-like repeat/Abnormal spindle-like microcephaly-assoc'd, ASPM-SPD-2-Hydin
MKAPFWSPVLLFIPMLVTNGAASADPLFGSPRNIPISGNFAPFIALGDLNNDGNLDIVVGSTCAATCEHGTITVLLGKGDGTFKSGSIYKTEYGTGPFAIADINGDGRLDVVAINACPFVGNGGCLMNGTIQVFLGNGDGTLRAPISSPTNLFFLGGPASAAVADFDGDGLLDLAVSFIGGGFIGPQVDSALVFKGNGNGSFGNRSELFLPTSAYDPVGMVAADFNGDGKPDLAVIASQHGNVNIFLGNGDGTFSPWSSFHTGPGKSLTAADINGDGHLDLAVSTAQPLRIAYGNGDGTFQTPIGLNTGTSDFFSDPRQVITGDFDGDGRLDLAVALGFSGMMAVYINKPNGTFQRRFFSSSGGSVGLAAGDLNHDGYPDIVGLNNSNAEGFTANSIDVFLNESATTLSPANLTFSPQVVGTTSAAKAVSLRNSGTKTLIINSISIRGTNAGSFGQTHTCAGSLVAGTSCNITVAFSPRGPGALTATLTVADNGTGSPQTVALSGIATTARLSPTSLGFGILSIGNVSAAKTVTLSNVGPTALSISGIAIAGTDGGDFAQTHTCGSSLAPRVSCTISVTFTPTASGRRTATLSVSDSAADSPQKIALAGTAP